MKLRNIYIAMALITFASCTESEPEIEVNDAAFPFRLVYDEEKGAAIAGEEDYTIKVEFADFIGDLPSSEIVLSYTLEGTEDFADVTIDEILYEYEGEDCVFEREVAFDGTTITIPVDADLGTVPSEIEIKAAFSDAAVNGGFEFDVTDLSSDADVLFNAVTTFEYEVLSNDVAGAWKLEFADEDEFNDFVDVLGIVSSDLTGLAFANVNEDSELKVEFEFKEMKFEIETTETEAECKNDETEDEAVSVEVEAEYDAEDGEIELEGKYVTEDGEELDFLMTGEYAFDMSNNLLLTISNIVNEDGDELFSGTFTITLEED